MYQQMVSVKEINGLIKALNSSLDFYQKAIEEVENPKIKLLLGRVRDQHEMSVIRLEPYANLANGEIEDGSNFAIEARNMYTQALAKLQSDSDLTFIDQLEEVEDKILEKINGVDETDLPQSAQQAFQQARFETQLTHTVMKILQEAREANSQAH